MVASLKADAIRHETHLLPRFWHLYNLAPVCLYYLGAEGKGIPTKVIRE